MREPVWHYYQHEGADSYRVFLSNFRKRKDETKTAWRRRAREEWLRQTLILGVTHEVHAPRDHIDPLRREQMLLERQELGVSLEEAMDDIWEGRSE